MEGTSFTTSKSSLQEGRFAVKQKTIHRGTDRWGIKTGGSRSAVGGGNPCETTYRGLLTRRKTSLPIFGVKLLFKGTEQGLCCRASATESTAFGKRSLLNG
jgi:hypothetical protein